jgi:hypothetical protein
MFKTIIKFKLILIIILITTNNRTINKLYANEYKSVNKQYNYMQLNIKEPQLITIDSFLSKNAYLESRHRPNIINRYGCIGKYQFQVNSLNELGFKGINTNKIKKSIKRIKDEHLGTVLVFDTTHFTEQQQDEVIKEYLFTLEHRYLKQSISRYVGKKIKGVRITKAGILSAGFFGYHKVYEFLSSNGRNNPKDGNGFSVKERLKLFEDVEIETEELYWFY